MEVEYANQSQLIFNNYLSDNCNGDIKKLRNIEQLVFAGPGTNMRAYSPIKEILLLTIGPLSSHIGISKMKMKIGDINAFEKVFHQNLQSLEIDLTARIRLSKNLKKTIQRQKKINFNLKIVSFRTDNCWRRYIPDDFLSWMGDMDEINIGW